MEGFGLMNYQEYLKKNEKKLDVNNNTSISFENFLKTKNFFGENSEQEQHSYSIPKQNEQNKTPLEKTPPKKAMQDYHEKISDSLKKIKILIDSSFKINDSGEENNSVKNKIPSSYLGPEMIKPPSNFLNQKNIDRNLAFEETLVAETDTFNEEVKFLEKKTSPEKDTKDQSNYESFQKENTQESPVIFNEIQHIKTSIDPKQRYPHLEIITTENKLIDSDIKPSETKEMKSSKYEENILSTEEVTKLIGYSSLKDRKVEFMNFMNNLGWKSKSFLKKKEEGEIGLMYSERQDFIKKLNSNICDFKESETILKQTLKNFRDSDEKMFHYSQPRIKELGKQIEKKWKEKLTHNSRDFENEKKKMINFDLEILIRNSRFQKKLS